MEFEDVKVLFIVGLFVQLAIYGAIGYAGYKILQHFGIF